MVHDDDGNGNDDDTAADMMMDDDEYQVLGVALAFLDDAVADVYFKTPKAEEICATISKYVMETKRAERQVTMHD